MTTCSVEGCDRTYRARGLCNSHYESWRKHGEVPTKPLPPKDPIERFWLRVTRTETCWLFNGSLSGGYGQFGINGGVRLAHRLAYEWYVGPIPEGLQLDHLCRVRNCVRPSHLEPVTAKENVIRGVLARGPITHCRHGHELDAENTYVWNGQRKCRECMNASGRRWRAKTRSIR